MTRKKITQENFRFRDFRFEIRLETFSIDFDQKHFFDQNFLSRSFFTILAEKRQSPSKKIYTGKNVRLRDFFGL